MAIAFAASGACTESAEEAPREPDPDRVVGVVPGAVRGVPSVVILVPEGAPPEQRTEATVIDQASMVFSPALLVASLDAPVEFINSEVIGHNVTVRRMGSTETLLNTDLDPDDRTGVVLRAEGGYDVTCSAHPGMTAFIYATAARWAVFAEPEGTFSLEGVPPGRYRLRVWSVDPELRSERSVLVGTGETRVAPPSEG